MVNDSDSGRNERNDGPHPVQMKISRNVLFATTLLRDVEIIPIFVWGKALFVPISVWMLGHVLYYLMFGLNGNTNHSLLLLPLLIKRYSLYKILVCSTTFFQLSLFCVNFFQLLTLMLFKSSKTSSSQRVLCLPVGTLFIVLWEFSAHYVDRTLS